MKKTHDDFVDAYTFAAEGLSEEEKREVARKLAKQEHDANVVEKLFIIGMVILCVAIIVLFVWLMYPTYTSETYDVSIDYDDEKDSYDCYCEELGHIYVKASEVEVRYSVGQNGAILKATKENRKIYKEARVKYILYILNA